MLVMKRGGRSQGEGKVIKAGNVKVRIGLEGFPIGFSLTKKC